MRTFHRNLSLVILTASLFLNCGKKGDSLRALAATENARPKVVPKGFVVASGEHFELDGKPFYFAGTSLYNLALLDGHSEEEIDGQLRRVSKAGIKVVRMWGFCNGEWNGTKPILLHPGAYSETAMRRFDFVLSKAAQYHIKLIIALSNFEPEYGGFDWYVKEVVGSGGKDLFLTDAKIKAAYKAYVAFILNRQNTISGLLYKSDPSVMAWELANEPKASYNFELHGGLKPGSLTYAWLSEMSSYVKSIDPQHMVSTGEEGYRSDGDTSSNGWINDGSKGEDYAKNITLPGIDFATVHTYPDAWNIPAAKLDGFLGEFIGDRIDLSYKAGKPLVIEEIGFVRAYGDRQKLMTTVYDFANSRDVAGVIVWRMVPYQTDDAGYDFGFSQNGSEAVLKQVRATNAR